MVVIFNLQSCHLLTLSLSTEEIILGKRPKLASGKSFSGRFSFSADRNANTKATEYVAFGFSFTVLVFFPSRKVWTLLSVSDTDFLVF